MFMLKNYQKDYDVLNMEYFGISLLFSHVDDVEIVKRHLLKNLGNLITPELYISHWDKDNFVDTVSPFFPDELWFDGLAQDSDRWRIVYAALSVISPQLIGKVAIEYQHPARPDDPFYMLIFDKNDISLGDDSQWEETLNIKVVESPYYLK